MREDLFDAIDRLENGGDGSEDDFDIVKHQRRLLGCVNDDTDGK